MFRKFASGSILSLAMLFGAALSASAYEEVFVIQILPEQQERFGLNQKDYDLIGFKEEEIPYIPVSEFSSVVFYEDAQYRARSANGSCKFFTVLIVENDKNSDGSVYGFMAPEMEQASSRCDAFKVNKENLDPVWIKTLTEADGFYRQSLSKAFFKSNHACLEKYQLSAEDIRSRHYQFTKDEIEKLSAASCVQNSKQNQAILQYISFPYRQTGENRIFDNMKFAGSAEQIFDF